MKKSALHLVVYALLALSSVLAIYFYLGRAKVQNSYVDLESKYEKAQDVNSAYSSLLTIDSMVLLGEYDQAKTAYERLLLINDSSLQSFVSLQLELMQHINRKQNTTDSALDSLGQAETGKIDQVNNEAVSPDNPVYDSLNFALTKATVQISNLRKQLKNAKSGEYLKFRNSKGNEVYYVGQLKNGKANGEGVALLSTGSRYEGGWLNNMRHGEGVFYWPDGAYYQGQYKEDKREGLGSYTWPNGERFVGKWANDQRNGFGSFYDQDEKVTIKGVWKNDELLEKQK